VNKQPGLAALYVDAGREATSGLRRNWPILFGSAGLVVLLLIVHAIFGQLGLAGGMIAGMAEVAILALHYSWLAATVDRERLTWRNLRDFDYTMFFTVISVGFIFFVVQFVASSLLQGLDQTPLLFLGLGLVVVFNAIPEVIIVERIEGVAALGRAAEFTRRHAFAWFVPLAVLSLPFLLPRGTIGSAGLEGLVLELANLNPLVPGVAVMHPLRILLDQVGALFPVLLIPLVIVVANWYTLFRVCLFRRLARLG
jgi:hypothetical protein